ncbi:hypothetical protein HK099_005071 [Clydaea vesicula]|uniref:RNA polymerase I-specific transcription initiation factor RRN3 n=1 Tax=Clydaea vesicula TaxID=447962 RepID=A0AAD5TZF4_9FUNG|nr:hypothetical protein HK099_005071 [Clydaea vesicula]
MVSAELTLSTSDQISSSFGKVKTQKKKRNISFHHTTKPEMNNTHNLSEVDLARLNILDIPKFIKSALMDKAMNFEEDILINWLNSFSVVTSSLDSACHLMVKAILRIDWLFDTNAEDKIKSDKFFKCFKNLMLNIVSAHAFYVVPVVRMLIESFKALKEHDPHQEVISDRIHLLLKKVLFLIPSGPTFVLSILTENFPFKSEDTFTHCSYVKSILRLVEYTPSLHSGVLNLIIDRLLQIDVEIQVDIDDFIQDDLENSGNTNFEEANSNVDIAESEDEIDEEAGDVIQVDTKKMVEKLDKILYILFFHIENVNKQQQMLKIPKSSKVNRATTPCSNTSSEEETDDAANGPLIELFEIFMGIFQRSVLPTHRSRFTQFLWFYICSLNPQFSDLFLGLLISKTFDPCSPEVLRLSACSYLASFVSRANYVGLEEVKTCLKLLCNWAINFVEQNENEFNLSIYNNFSKKNDMGTATKANNLKIQLDIKKYSIFYATVQSILYVFCFRWRNLLDGEQEELNNKCNYNDDGNCLINFEGLINGRFPPEMRGFQRVLQSKFQPLKFGIVNSVILESAKVLHKLQVFYCYPYMNDHNKLNAEQEEKEVAADFFPFDPFSLTNCERFIEGLYVVYKPLVIEAEEDVNNIEDYKTEEERLDNSKFTNDSDFDFLKHFDEDEDLNFTELQNLSRLSADNNEGSLDFNTDEEDFF